MTRGLVKKIDALTTKAPVILAIESSGDLLSVALWADGTVCHHEFCAGRHGHAAHIVTIVEQLMKSAKITYAQITHIAAGCGPGSFTGIRVALAAAKGFCLSTGAAGIGINGLAALAAHHCGSVPVLVSAETRRGPCYAQLFDRDGTALTSAFETLPSEISSALPSGLAELVIAGWQADKLAASLRTAGKGVFVEAVHGAARVDATHIAAFAEGLIEADEAGEEMTPLYLAPAFIGLDKQAGK